MGGGDHLEHADRHQAALAAAGTRRARGAYYTPPDVVERLLDLALDPVLARRRGEGPAAVASMRVLDPACGAGNVLVAAARRIASVLVELGVSPQEAARHGAAAVRGADTDGTALAICARSLEELGGAPVPVGSLVEIDPLRTDLPFGAVDVVVGNPPFLGQLLKETAADPAERRARRDRFGPAASAYTDPAWLFLLLSVRSLAPGGSLALVQPLSLLSARDAGGVRSAVVAEASLRGVWLPEGRRFDAAVEVVVPVVDLLPSGDARPTVPGAVVWRGDAIDEVTRTSVPPTGSWSSLLAAADEVPEVAPEVGGRLGDLVRATADFRDQYYGLVPHVVDRADADDLSHPPLVTVGQIDPAKLWWGERPCRFAKQAMVHPRVPIAALAPSLQAWARNRLVPKVLIATQTRVPEVVVDAPGRLLPSVPTISVSPLHDGAGAAGDALLWRVAAVLSSPVVAALAARRHGGSGRTASAIRLRAADIGDLPLPVDATAWDEAARHVRAAHEAATGDERVAWLHHAAASMQVAYRLEVDHPVVAWWAARLPAR